MLKGLVRDSLVYGLANAVQRLVPFLIIPVITNWLGSEALKIYDVSFVYAYLCSWLVIMGQDSATSIYYFGKSERFDKKQVLNHGLLIQFGTFIVLGLLFFPVRYQVAGFLFQNDNDIQRFWLYALFIVPAHVLLNYVMNILIWQKQKKKYFLICVLQVALTLGGAFVSIMLLHGTIAHLFFILIGATALTAITGLWMVRESLFQKPFAVNQPLLKKLALVGLPFALTSFFHQLLPSIDRFFLLNNNYHAEMPQYILAVKIGGILSVAISAFALAFTPYSMSKMHDEQGEKDISTLFQFVSIVAMLAVPVLLLFKGILVRFFADSSYESAERLLPAFFFGWVFDLFSYFSLLGIYKSEKSYLVLLLFLGGVLLIAGLNSLLIPKYGIYGAAISFCITKAVLFFVPLIYLAKYFRVTIQPQVFILFLLVAVFCSFMVFQIGQLQYMALLAIVLTASLFYLLKLFRKHKHILAI